MKDDKESGTSADKKLLALEAQRKALDARIKRIKKQKTLSTKSIDTRRKVLAGAAVLQWATKDDEFANRLRAELQVFLVRNDDRALFDLSPLELANG